MTGETKWCEVNIRTDREAEEAVSYVLDELGISSVVIQSREDNCCNEDCNEGYNEDINVFNIPVLVKCYLPCDDFLAGKLGLIKQKIIELGELGFEVDENCVDTHELEDDWQENWKKFFETKRVSKVLIKPTWEELFSLEEDEVVIELEPGMAFGTGLHPTTEACLRFIQLYLSPEDRVLDLGCGSGILSIACAKLGAEVVHSYDFSPEACRVTEKNARLNKAEDKIKVYEVDINKTAYPCADIIVGNLNTKEHLKLFNYLSPYLNRGGFFILSGVIEHKRDCIVNEASAKGFKLVKEEIKREWLTLVLKKD